MHLKFSLPFILLISFSCLVQNQVIRPSSMRDPIESVPITIKPPIQIDSVIE
jgi:hypothetical protein